MNQASSSEPWRSETFFGDAASENLKHLDCAWSQAAAVGSKEAMENLYKRHQPRVYSLCLRMTRNPADAEDLTQEVFIHLFRKIGSFRGDSKFTSWLHRLTVNLVLMHFRHKATRREKIPDNIEAKILVFQNGKQSVARQAVDRIALAAALEQLPAGCRSVFELFDIEGYNHWEIAARLGCTVGTSKSQLHKARRKLRRLLKAQQPQSDTCPLSPPSYPRAQRNTGG